MGYQESLIKVNNGAIFNSGEIFDALVAYLDVYKEDLKILINLATIVTFKENVSTQYGKFFNKGEKCICITGERCGQNKGFIFKEFQSIGANTSIIQVEDFTHNRLEKMFNTHESASEISFEKYVEENIKEIADYHEAIYEIKWDNERDLYCLKTTDTGKSDGKIATIFKDTIRENKKKIIDNEYEMER